MICIADGVHDRVVELDHEGKPIGTFGSEGDEEGQFRAPRAIGASGPVLAVTSFPIPVLKKNWKKAYRSHVEGRQRLTLLSRCTSGQASELFSRRPEDFSGLYDACSSSSSSDDEFETYYKSAHYKTWAKWAFQ